ncbi:MAG: hypothetical protein ACRENB_09005, partial [Gemmatimonadales bacterium]
MIESGGANCLVGALGRPRRFALAVSSLRGPVWRTVSWAATAPGAAGCGRGAGGAGCCDRAGIAKVTSNS